MRWEYAGKSDIGKVRQGNEDALFANEERGVFIVADGMGGHVAGEVASQIVTETVGPGVSQALEEGLEGGELENRVLELIEDPLDLMVVIGGYNSSNTNHLAKICAARRPTFHIADASCIDVEIGAIRYKPVDSTSETESPDWLGEGCKVIGITAGASTPNNKIGETIERILQVRGLSIPD